MSIHDRKRKIAIGIAFIEEAIADVLREAQEAGIGRMSNRQIRERVGLPEEERNRELLNIVLAGMVDRGEVKPYTGDRFDQQRWELSG